MLTKTRIDEAWDAVEGRAEKKLYPYQAAAELGLSEAEFLATKTGDCVTRLSNDVSRILEAFKQLGTVKVITRNPHAVHEKIGSFSKVQVDAMHALVLDKNIDLRISPSQWAFAFAHVTFPKDKRQVTFQIFDRAGDAVFKVFVNESVEVAEEVIKELTAEDQSQELAVVKAPEAARSDAHAVDEEQLELDWLAITDPHQFFGVLRKHKIDKSIAYRVVAHDLARPVAAKSLRQILEAAATEAVPIMVFVGNHGCTQIHTGPVSKIVEHGPWINVLDETFHLHEKEGEIADAYVEMKPAEEGRKVYSLECFDKNGLAIISVYGERKLGVDELTAWRDLLTRLVAGDES